jgi:LacI family transcriptional regulator
MRAAGLSVPPDAVVVDLDTMDAADRTVSEIFRGADPPTALFTSQNLVTIGAIHALRRLGLQRRVAVVGFDDFLLADLLEPAVTVVAQDPHEIGRRAAHLLFGRIEGAAPPYVHEVVATRLLPRGSGEIPPPDRTASR